MLSTNTIRNDFSMNDSIYLLNHSVGRPLKTSESNVDELFFRAWKSNEPWHEWMHVFTDFQNSISQLLQSHPTNFCPQTNVSAAFTKVLFSLPKNENKKTILLSEYDFPSVGFVAAQAKILGYELKFIPKDVDQTNPDVWNDAMTNDVQWVIITQVQSNTGVQVPVSDITAIANKKSILSVVDVAQSVGILPINLETWNASFVIGSCVKWLCGGPGAGFLYVNPSIISQCKPIDVGWFSHENPFEFDIHHFTYDNTALRFFGGTPSVLPFVLATHSINYLTKIGIDNIRNHNVSLSNQLINAIAPQYVVSPKNEHQSSGTMIINFKEHQEKIITALKANNILFDARAFGIRLSPHIYNTKEEMEKVAAIISAQL
jgi:kynureninase